MTLTRGSGEGPVAIAYLKAPPSRAELANFVGRRGLAVRDLLAHPSLIDRPVVVTRDVCNSVGLRHRPGAARRPD